MQGRSHRSQAIAHASVGMTWLLSYWFPQPQMPAAAQANVGMTLMPSTNKQSLTELIRSIRKASAWFGSIRLEKEKPKGMSCLLGYKINSSSLYCSGTIIAPPKPNLTKTIEHYVVNHCNSIGRADYCRHHGG